jgi:hypothetical protein
METKKTQCHPNLSVNATCLLGEKGCYKNGKCHYIGNCEHKVLTHADCIRAMSDEELARFLECFGCCHNCSEHHRLGDVGFYKDERCDEQCEQHCLEWLKQPVEDELWLRKNWINFPKK